MTNITFGASPGEGGGGRVRTGTLFVAVSLTLFQTYANHTREDGDDQNTGDAFDDDI